MSQKNCKHQSSTDIKFACSGRLDLLRDALLLSIRTSDRQDADAQISANSMTCSVCAWCVCMCVCVMIAEYSRSESEHAFCVIPQSLFCDSLFESLKRNLHWVAISHTYNRHVCWLALNKTASWGVSTATLNGKDVTKRLVRLAIERPPSCSCQGVCFNMGWQGVPQWRHDASCKGTGWDVCGYLRIPQDSNIENLSTTASSSSFPLVGCVEVDRELSISGFTASQETTFGPFEFGLQKDSGFGCCKDGHFGIQMPDASVLGWFWARKGTLWSVLGMNAMGMSHNLPPWEDAVAWKWYFTHLKSPQGFWVTRSNFSW